MIEEEAVVTQLEANQAWIKRLHIGGCSGCLQQTTCGTSVLSKLLPKREFAVDNDMALKVGDKVTVAVDDSQLLFSSFLLYLLPLLVMFIAVIATIKLFPTAFVEYWLPVIAIFALLFSFYLIHRIQAVLVMYFCSKPQIVAKTD
ncbi:MAG: SoxR reducing system RseC family protein [Methylococcaceae bacterium]|nr:SoxR reducing system RseC family protein [Methylococcaceae bacterium]